MIQVRKCDYCPHWSISQSVIKIHEKICTYNPVNMTCSSCKYSDTYFEYFDDGDIYCTKHHTGDHMNEVMYGNADCPDWEKE